MKIVAWVVGVPLAIVFLLFLYGTFGMSAKESKKYEQQIGLDRVCDQLMSDAALGAERRDTRAACDAAKAKIH